MEQSKPQARSLFLSPEGRLLSDSEICSGRLPPQLGGKPCPFSDAGRMPQPTALDEVTARRLPELGQPGDLAPPCAVQHLGRLGNWRQGEANHAEELRDLRLFKCRQMFLLVVPGLRHDRPGEIEGERPIREAPFAAYRVVRDAA